MNFNLWALALIMASAILPACNDELHPVVEEEACTTMPPTTSIMLTTWAEADTYYQACWTEVQHDAEQCWTNDGEDCSELRDQGELSCSLYRAQRVNKIPLRECGARVYIITRHNGEVVDVSVDSLSDDDGDGVSNWHEYWIGMNPCQRYSFGSCWESDGELDYDADGLGNAEDPAPLCHGQFGQGDPAGYISDCV